MPNPNNMSAPGVYFEEAATVPRIDSTSELTTYAALITERGPIGEAPLHTSFEAWKATFGGFTANNAAGVAGIQSYFANGGSRLRTSRITHVATPGDPTSTTSAKGSLALLTAEADPTAGSTVSGAQPFNLEPSHTLVVAFETGGDQTFTITATAASVESAAEPFDLADDQTFIFAGESRAIDVSEVVDIDAVTAEELVAIFNPFFLSKGLPLIATLTTGNTKVKVSTVQRGSGASFTLAGTGLAGVAGSFTAGTKTGTGNVADVDNVTAAEIATIASAITNGTVSSTGGVVRFTSATTGASSTAQVKSASTADTAMGFNNANHAGSDGTPVTTWTFEGKTDGAYANAISIKTSAASNGDALSVNVEFRRGGVIEERWPNLSADPDSAQFVETVINDAQTGSNLLSVTDAGVGLPPALGTAGPLTGGDDGLAGLVDADYIGDVILSPTKSATGIRVFDSHDDGDILIMPGRATAACAEAMIAYAEINKKRKLFTLHDPPENYSATQMLEYVTDTAALFGRTRLGATHWPRGKIVNPSSEVFGSVTTISCPPSGTVAGICARIQSAKIGGAFDQPAGADTRYVPVDYLGFETANGESPALEDVELLFPKNVNVIRRSKQNIIFIDGARVFDISAAFPSIGQARGVIYVQKKIDGGIEVLVHRNINEDLYAAFRRIATSFLFDLTRAGALASRDPKKAFFVDCGKGLNTPAVQAARTVAANLGLATSVPGEFFVIKLGPDTRAADAELATVL